MRLCAKTTSNLLCRREYAYVTLRENTSTGSFDSACSVVTSRARSEILLAGADRVVKAVTHPPHAESAVLSVLSYLPRPFPCLSLFRLRLCPLPPPPQLLLSQEFEFDIVYTSMLKRAIKTAWVVLDELNQQSVPVTTDWHLNERCYGALVGREKKECVRVFGAEQVRVRAHGLGGGGGVVSAGMSFWAGGGVAGWWRHPATGLRVLPVFCIGVVQADLNARMYGFWSRVMWSLRAR